MDSIFEQVQLIFRDILDQLDIVLPRDSNANMVEDWDSLSHVNLGAVIERRRFDK